MKNIVVYVLSVCLLIGTLLSALPTVTASAFEHDNSFLTEDQYEGLGLSLGSAASKDQNPNAHPLQDLNQYTFHQVRYGWSNPQVLAVMLSSPYWNELDYGADMNAAGSTEFSVSVGVETSETTSLNIAVGGSVTLSAKAEIFGNGVEVGGEIGVALDETSEVQSSKVTTKTLTFQAGAGEDHVALLVFPMACYEYSYQNDQDEAEYMYVSMQLEPIGKVTTLENYNRVILEHNAAQELAENKLPLIRMQTILPSYVTGDPSTLPDERSDIPAALVFENGQLTAASDTSSADTRLTGEIFLADTAYSVGLGNADTGTATTLEIGESDGYSNRLAGSLNVSAFAQFSEGLDVGVATVSTGQRFVISGTLSTAATYATVNTSSMAFSMGYIDLPSSAQTGTTGTGIPTSDYAFNARLMVWTPSNVGADVAYAPSIIGSIVEFADVEESPLYLPDDLHVSHIGDAEITLSWSLPDFDTAPFSYRKPTYYDICTPAQGGSTSYTVIGTVSADDTQFTVTNLKSDVDYAYCLRARSDDGRTSTYGPTVAVSLNRQDGPVITAQPTDTTAPLNGQALLTVKAEPTSPDYTLSYQWYKLETGRYGASWQAINEARSATFNAAYFDPDGTVNAANRHILHHTIYRCEVIQSDGATAVAAVSDAAVLSVENKFILRSYDDLRTVADNVQTGGEIAATAHYVLANDIVCPADETWHTPIGTQAHPFTGIFDGQGHTIQGLHLNTTDQGYSGLFGYVRGATIQNLILTDVDIYTTASYTGAVCGYAENSTITDCEVRGKLAGYSTASLGGGYGVAGICGKTDGNTVVARCVNHASVTGQISYMGGIVAQQSGGTVTDCANHGSLKIYCPVDADHLTMNAYLGGIVGHGNGTVRNCINTFYVSYSKANPQNNNLANNITAVNSYYVNNISNSVGGRTAAQFASGEVAYLLNSGVTDGTQYWYQDLDNGNTPQAYPHLCTNGDDTVYALSDGAYSNTPDIGIVQGTKPTVSTTGSDVPSPQPGESAYAWVGAAILLIVSFTATILCRDRKNTQLNQNE